MSLRNYVTDKDYVRVRVKMSKNTPRLPNERVGEHLTRIHTKIQGELDSIERSRSNERNQKFRKAGRFI